MDSRVDARCRARFPQPSQGDLISAEPLKAEMRPQSSAPPAACAASLGAFPQSNQGDLIAEAGKVDAGALRMSSAGATAATAAATAAPIRVSFDAGPAKASEQVAGTASPPSQRVPCRLTPEILQAPPEPEIAAQLEIPEQGSIPSAMERLSTASDLKNSPKELSPPQQGSLPSPSRSFNQGDLKKSSQDLHSSVLGALVACGLQEEGGAELTGWSMRVAAAAAADAKTEERMSSFPSASATTDVKFEERVGSFPITSAEPVGGADGKFNESQISLPISEEPAAGALESFKEPMCHLPSASETEQIERHNDGSLSECVLQSVTEAAAGIADSVYPLLAQLPLPTFLWQKASGEQSEPLAAGPAAQASPPHVPWPTAATEEARKASALLTSVINSASDGSSADGASAVIHRGSISPRDALGAASAAGAPATPLHKGLGIWSTSPQEKATLPWPDTLSSKSSPVDDSPGDIVSVPLGRETDRFDKLRDEAGYCSSEAAPTCTELPSPRLKSGCLPERVVPSTRLMAGCGEVTGGELAEAGRAKPAVLRFSASMSEPCCQNPQLLEPQTGLRAAIPWSADLPSQSEFVSFWWRRASDVDPFSDETSQSEGAGDSCTAREAALPAKVFGRGCEGRIPQKALCHPPRLPEFERDCLRRRGDLGSREYTTGLLSEDALLSAPRRSSSCDPCLSISGSPIEVASSDLDALPQLDAALRAGKLTAGHILESMRTPAGGGASAAAAARAGRAVASRLSADVSEFRGAAAISCASGPLDESGPVLGACLQNSNKECSGAFRTRILPEEGEDEDVISAFVDRLLSASMGSRTEPKKLRADPCLPQPGKREVAAHCRRGPGRVAEGTASQRRRSPQSTCATAVPLRTWASIGSQDRLGAEPLPRRRILETLQPAASRERGCDAHGAPAQRLEVESLKASVEALRVEAASAQHLEAEGRRCSKEEAPAGEIEVGDASKAPSAPHMQLDGCTAVEASELRESRSKEELASEPELRSSAPATSQPEFDVLGAQQSTRWPGLHLCRPASEEESSDAIVELRWGEDGTERHCSISRLKLVVSCLDADAASAALGNERLWAWAFDDVIFAAFLPSDLGVPAGAEFLRRLPAHVGASRRPARLRLKGLPPGDVLKLRVSYFSFAEGQWANHEELLVACLPPSHRCRSLREALGELTESLARVGRPNCGLDMIDVVPVELK